MSSMIIAKITGITMAMVTCKFLQKKVAFVIKWPDMFIYKLSMLAKISYFSWDSFASDPLSFSPAVL